MNPRTSSAWRPIHKALLTSKKWRRTNDDGRILYIALHLASDSYGAIELRDIAQQCFPSVPGWDDDQRISSALTDLERVNLITTGHVTDRGNWAWIVDFDDHQPQRSLSKRGPQRSPKQPGAPDVTPVGPPRELENKRKDQDIESTEVLLSDETSDAPKTETADDPMNEQAQIVWEHWLAIAAPIVNPNGHAKRRRLTNDRRRVIYSRLKEGYTPAELTQAIDGFAADDFHRGKNDQKTVYLDITTIFRRASKVDAGIAIAGRSSQRREEVSKYVRPKSVV